MRILHSDFQRKWFPRADRASSGPFLILPALIDVCVSDDSPIARPNAQMQRGVISRIYLGAVLQINVKSVSKQRSTNMILSIAFRY